jgi:hypothetical protein
MADQAPKVKGVADIVFLLDVTGSMGPCIDALKNNIGVFIDSLTATGPNNQTAVRDWRGKVVGYRDFECPDVAPFEDNPFVTDTAALKAQLAALKADGGGDAPETLLDALFKVASMPQTGKGEPPDASKWRYASGAVRVVVVFSDAGFKEKMTIPEASGGTIEDVKNVCMQNRIKLSVYAPQMPCYDEFSDLPGSEIMSVPGADPVAALRDFTADQKNFQHTLQQLAKTVTASAVVTV